MQSQLEGTILEMAASDLNGVATSRICKFTRKTPQELGDEFERLLAEGKLLGFAGVWFSPAAFEAGANRLIEALAELNTGDVPPKQAAAAAGLKWEGKTLDRILAKLGAAGRIELRAEGISLPSFKPELTPRQRSLMDRIIEILESEPVSTPTPHAIALTLGLPQQAVDEILRLAGRRGEVIQLADVVYYTPSQIESLKQRILTAVEGRPFSSTALRDSLQTTRKYILPLLDYLDENGFTKKIGQHRVVL